MPSVSLPVAALARPVALATALVLAIVAAALGAWWLTPAAGAVFGLLVRRSRTALPLALIAGAVAWLAPLPLLLPAALAARTAAVLAGILGVGALGASGALVLTALVGAILSLSGAWLGAALRSSMEG
jgi:hypothetical protein